MTYVKPERTAKDSRNYDQHAARYKSGFRKASALAVQGTAASMLAILALPFLILIAVVAMFGDGYPDFEED